MHLKLAYPMESRWLTPKFPAPFDAIALLGMAAASRMASANDLDRADLTGLIQTFL